MMVHYFVEGGIWFMGTLSILFLVILSLSVIAGTLAFKSTSANADIELALINISKPATTRYSCARHVHLLYLCAYFFVLCTLFVKFAHDQLFNA